MENTTSTSTPTANPFPSSRIWPFFLTRTVHIKRRIPHDSPEKLKESILAVLHEPSEVFRLSPLVSAVKPDPPSSSPSPDHGEGWYTVDDSLPMSFLGMKWVSVTQFRCKWTNTPEGGNGDVIAGAGTRLKSEMRVSVEEGGDAVIFEEKIVVQGLFLFMGFVTSTMTKAHEGMQQRLEEKVLQEALKDD